MKIFFAIVAIWCWCFLGDQAQKNAKTRAENNSRNALSRFLKKAARESRGPSPTGKAGGQPQKGRKSRRGGAKPRFNKA